MNTGKKLPFIWTEALRTGHDEIDRQHQKLYEAFHGLSRLLTVPGVHIDYWFGMVMRQADDYVLNHFRDEEALQAEIGYPRLGEHKKQHEGIVDDLKKHRAVIVKLKTNPEKIEEAEKLMRFLSDWLEKHVLIEDMDIVDFLKARR